MKKKFTLPRFSDAHARVGPACGISGNCTGFSYR